MKVSFIIISYNELEYLQKAIESCLAQNLNDFEIIIGDDGSTDDSVSLIETYAKAYPERIRYFVSDRSDVRPGKVIASIRVTNVVKSALQMAQGQYCQILSGDDYLYPGKFLRDAVSFLDANDDYIAYVGAFEKVWEDRDPVLFRSSYPPRLYWSGAYVHLTSFVFRKDMLKAEELLDRFCDDTGLHYVLAHSGKWKYSKEPVFAYRQRGGSIMHASDRLELDIAELMMLQDVLQKGFLYKQSLARFSSPLYYVFRHRRELAADKYSKYLESCNAYDHNILQDMLVYDSRTFGDKMHIFFWVIHAKCLGFFYDNVRLLYRVWHKVFTST